MGHMTMNALMWIGSTCGHLILAHPRTAFAIFATFDAAVFVWMVVKVSKFFA